MPRRVIGCLLLLPGLTAAPAAPVPREHRRPVPYFPTAVGTRWVYERDGRELVDTVTAAERAGGAVLVTVRREDSGTVVGQDKLLVSGEGVFRVAATGQRLDPPVCLVRLPVPARWAVTGGGVTGTCAARRVEAVDVPAGRFEAVRVDGVYTVHGTAATSTEWYAPGVGVVRQETGVGSTLRLVSFTPGRD